MSIERPVLNGYQCYGLDFTYGDYTGAMIFGDKGFSDPSNLINEDSYQFFFNGEESSATDLTDLQELSTHYCRHQYDLFELTDGFCCQAISIYNEGQETESEVYSFVVDGSTSTAYAPTDTTFDFFVTFEIYFGANYFASAHATAASLLALAASTIAFTQ